MCGSLVVMVKIKMRVGLGLGKVSVKYQLVYFVVVGGRRGIILKWVFSRFGTEGVDWTNLAKSRDK
jgi:hypothetical protein